MLATSNVFINDMKTSKTTVSKFGKQNKLMARSSTVLGAAPQDKKSERDGSTRSSLNVKSRNGYLFLKNST